MTLSWPLAIVIVVVFFMVVVTATTPAYRRSRFQLEEMKAKYNEQYQTLAADYAQLAGELRDSQAAIQADLAKLTTAVESIEAMMREVGWAVNGGFFVPIATMLGGVVVFVTFAIWHALVGKRKALSPRLLAGVCLVAGGLVVFSGFSWFQAQGPAVGQVVRLILLSGMAAFAYRKIGPAAASGLAAEAGVIGALAVVAFL